MSSTDYAAKLALIEAIDPATLKKPNIPVKAYLQEAENLYHWAQEDKTTLQSAGLPWAWVQDLPQRIGALREAESLWFKERFGREEAQQQWDQEAPAAYALRDQMLRAMRYAYRRDDALLKRVSDIAEGTGHVDMIQDLNDVAILGRANAEPLLAVGVDAEALDLAASTAADMADLLAMVNGERAHGSSARVIRDQAYTHLKEAVDEIRACGEYVFWDNPARLDGYHSQYRRARRSGTASPVPQQQETGL
ncbi:MAG: hypothetical protein VXY23_15230 [Pseudomonadota bacterium]|nr:hypothetical protein [Pseudomonadota bacterium]